MDRLYLGMLLITILLLLQDKLLQIENQPKIDCMAKIIVIKILMISNQ